MNTLTRSLCLFALTILAVVGVMGCGGAGGSSGSAATGSATMQVIWPEETRLIPAAAKSIVATISNGTSVVASQTISRPTSGNTSTVTFTKLPASTLIVSSVAYPNSDGTGVAQARAQSTIRIVADESTTLSLTMGTTIVAIDMSPATVTIGLKATQQIVATPLDSSDNTVLVADSKITWESSDESVATVSDTGLVTALASGTTDITFTDSESGKVGTSVVTVSSTGGGSIVDLANAYIDSLSTAQKTASVVSSSATNAAKWSDLAATPASDGTNSLRNGVAYSTLSTAQKTAFSNLAQAALGTVGYERLQQVLAADDYLNDTDTDYSGTYAYIGFVGTPSDSGNWMLQIGAHHYAANVFFQGNTPVAATPYFAGVEPASFTLNSTTYTPLATQRTAMLNLLASLSSTQRANAKLSTSFTDVLLGSGQDARSNFPTGTTGRGILGSTLTDTQQALLLTAIKAWTADSNLATQYNALYENELDNTYLAWSGTINLTTARDYVRIDGPHVWIELYVKSGEVLTGVHYHSVWRDRVTDYNAAFGF